MYACTIDKINNDFIHNNIINFAGISGIAIKEFHAKFTTKSNKSYVKTLRQLTYPNLREDCLYMSMIDRNTLELSLTDRIKFEKIILEPIKTLIVSVTNLKNQNMIINDSIEFIKKNILNTAASIELPIYANVSNNHCKLTPITIISHTNTELTWGQIIDSTEIIIYSEKTKSMQMNLSSISFENINVGGLSSQFKQLVENIFLTRIIPRSIYNKLGIKHVKGAILYGPPGCGKTRIARELGRIIGCKNITIINGPEILSKWVGESEKNLRAIFEKAKENPSEMNLLIFDEFDSIATVRGKSLSNNHDDRLVGQLLTMLDGIDDQTDNMIVFAMTNRLDQLDPAVLRPGRFGIHLYVGLPNEEGRTEILKIHSKSLIENNMLIDVDFKELSKITDNYTGAELESLVQKTVQNVLGSQIDFNNIMESVKKIDNIKISQNDFIIVSKTINPQFKISNDKIKSYSNRIRIDFNNEQKKIIDEICASIKLSTYPNIIAISGIARSGKTSVVCQIIKNLNMKFNFVNPRDLIDMDTNKRSNYLTDIFNSTTDDIIIIDNVENIIEFVMQTHFNAKLLWLLRTLISETNKHVIMTTSYYDDLENLTLMHGVTYHYLL